MFLPLLVLCDLLLNRPTATCHLFVLHNDQKTKKTDTHTCLVPHDLKICAFQSQTQFFVSASSFFPFTYLYTVSSKPFLWFFLAQSRLMAKTFCKIASLFFSFSRVLRRRKYSWQSESRSIFLHKWCHVPCVMTSSNMPSLSILNIWTLGGLTALKSFNSYGIGFEHQHGTLAPEVLSRNA